MNSRAIAIVTTAVLICMIPAAGFALTPYSQDFESVSHTGASALADDGWLVFGNVFAPDLTYLYGYGPFPAPNDGFAFCQVDTGQGGTGQGQQQLVVFSDYNNGDHGNSNLIEANTFQEQTVGPEDVGTLWTFDFEAKMGNLEGSSTALAFIKTLNPAAGWITTNYITVALTAIDTTWSGYSLSLEIDASLDGQILQIGFSNLATNYEGSGIFYDNLNFDQTDVSSVPDVAELMGVSLRQNYPNPFNPSTRIDFTLERAGSVDISVYNLAGRRIATLQHGELGIGDHHVTWNGRTDSGATAPSGQYRYVLKTASGQVSHSMVLLK